jgi:DNA-binding transcriptional MerR regulator
MGSLFPGPNPNIEKKVPTHELYAQVYKELKVNPRTLQWYATEGYIPKPEKNGVEAFYSPSDQIMTRVRVIQLLQKRFELKLKEIKKIVERQSETDWESIYDLLMAAEELFPYQERNSYGDECVSEKGAWIGSAICDLLKDKSREEIDLADIEESYHASKNKPESLEEIFSTDDEMPF